MLAAKYTSLQQNLTWKKLITFLCAYHPFRLELVKRIQELALYVKYCENFPINLH